MNLCVLLGFVIQLTGGVLPPELIPSDTPFGREMMEFFAMNPNLINLNQGSYGATPKAILQASNDYRMQMEYDPDRFFRQQREDLMVNAKAKLAEYINADPDDLAFVENASDGVNTVLRSLQLQPGDKIFTFDFAYFMVLGTSNWIVDQVPGAELITVDIEFPIISNDDILRTVRQVLFDHGEDIKIALIDHISSVPSVIIPVKEIVEEFHNFGVPVFVDGAHALGQIDIDLEDLNCDYYTANGHKWLFVPKSSAFLYVRKDLQDSIAPTVIASYPSFPDTFIWTGTRDYSAHLAIVDAIEFRSLLGEDNIHNWNNGLKRFAEDYLSLLWETEKLDQRPNELYHQGMIAGVRVPTDDIVLAQKAVELIWDELDCYVVVFQWGDKIWVRLSAQIYNEEQDFIKMGTRFLEIINELESEKAT